jgi:predicted  nucleic acid-binding Zn-ribbon protein
MFNLPPGNTVDAEVDLSVGQNQMPFETGVISHYKPRAKTACAHRLVYGGRVVGWLAESDAKQTFVTGEGGRNRLLELSDAHELSSRGATWTASQFTEIARRIPEAFSDPSDVAALLAQGAAALPIDTVDLALLVDRLIESDEVMGALAFEDGVVIHSNGNLPSTPEELATLGQEHLRGISAKFTQAESLSANLRLEGGQLMLTEAGQASVAIWCKHGSDAHAALANAASLVGSIDEEITAFEVLPEGFVTKESKSGIDQLISHLRAAHENKLTGYLESVSEKDESIFIILVNGVPSGLRESNDSTLADTIHAMTTSSRRLLTHRLERRARLGLTGSTVEDFSLAHLTDSIANCRTRSDDRKKLVGSRLDALFGFDLGLEAMESGRSAWKMLETGSSTAKLMPASSAKVLTPASGELKKRLEQLEHTQISLEREKGRLERELEDARAARDDAREQMHDLESTLSEARDERSELHREIDDMTSKVRTAESGMDEAATLSNRLAKRVSELEHMVEKRAEELASALGEFDSREAMLEDLRDLSNQEATIKSELSSSETRLDEVRKAIDHDERLQRVLTEQVSAQRDRHRTGQGELDEVERRIENQRSELADLEAEGHAHRRLMEEERGRILDSERKSTIMQSELREMMEERRLLLRELGDLDARKAQSETELRMLLEQAEDIQEAHEMALLDLQEADKIRARLAEEPLAQALLGDERGLSSLEPVLDRMANARSRGYSIVLLDRAVERALSIIQHSVDEVAKTPRHLLSFEVMELLERQAPETASTVRGLTRWSVQSRLEHQLAETVQHVVIDLEGLLDEYERSVTMLAQLQEVLRGLVDLGLPSEDIKPLERFSHMPEALPYISVEARRLIQRSLDEIYLDADRRTAGDAVGLAETVEVLESLLRRLDVAGLTGEEPAGVLWSFQRTGSLPFEVDGLARHERPEINSEAVRHMNPIEDIAEETSATSSVIAPSAPTAAPTPESSSAPASNSTWQPIEPPSESDGVDISARISAGLTPADVAGDADEASLMANIDVALSEVDSAARTRDGTENGITPPSDPARRDALDDLERELSDLDM